LLLVLPDGSKSLVPAAWTDVDPWGVDEVASMSTLGSLSDLLRACDLVVDLADGRGVERGQAARKSPCEEDFHAACPAQSDARPGPGTTGPGQGSVNRGGRGGDRGAGRRDRQGRRTARDEAAREGGDR
jgi:hypothetical protein